MALNFSSINQQSMENLMPIFGSLVNSGRVLIPNHANIINHFVANSIPAVTAASTVASTLPLNKSSIGMIRGKVSSAAPSTNNTESSNRTSKMSGAASPSSNLITDQRSKDNQGGTAPMDLESDLDAENDCLNAISSTILTPTRATLPSSVTAEDASAVISNASEENILMNMLSDAGSYMNGFINHSNLTMSSGPYVLYPTGPTVSVTTASTAAGTSTSGSNKLLDSSTFLAAAMHQLQQQPRTTFPAFVLTETSNALNNTVSINSNGNKLVTTESMTGVSGVLPREIIKTKNFTLLPPNPHGPRPTIRERPPGCRTVFVGGLPENITEDHLRQIFEVCGEISTLRMSKKNFCHIRFRLEESIDRAITFSGYRIRLSTHNNSNSNSNPSCTSTASTLNMNSNGCTNESANYGRLHVDYAQARDDQYEFECRQRQMQREQRHREHHRSRERSRSETPPVIPHYSDLEASLMGEQLRKDDAAFLKAVHTISTWLERGDCNKRNANTFYSMLQSTHAHVRRLTSEKQQLENNLNRIRETYRKQMLAVSSQFTQIEKVFNAASHKKVWDHFSKAQRKNIDQWKKLAMALRSTQSENDEMELSDGDTDEINLSSNSSFKQRRRLENDRLKEENDSLRCQLEALRNEIRSELNDSSYNCEIREQQIEVLQETIRNLQAQWLQLKMPECLKNLQNVGQFEKHLKHQAAVNDLLSQTPPKKRSMNSLRTNPMYHGEHTVQLEVIDSLEAVNSSLECTRGGVQSLKCSHVEKVVPIIDIDIDKSDDEEVKIVEDVSEIEGTSASNRRLSANLSFKRNKTSNVEFGGNSNAIKDLSTKGEDFVSVSSAAMPSKNTVQDGNKIHKNLLNLSEVHLVALSAVYLLIHPNGARTEQLYAYFKTQTNQTTEISAGELNKINDILSKYGEVFSGEEITLGAENEHSRDKRISMKWKFCGFLRE